MPQGTGTYGNQVGRPTKKKLAIGKDKPAGKPRKVNPVRKTK